MDLTDFIRSAPVLLDFEATDEHAALAAVCGLLRGQDAAVDYDQLMSCLSG
jgi:hypothetical protein